MEYIELIKGFVLSPGRNLPGKVKDTDYNDTLVYFLVLVVTNTVLSVLIMRVSLPSVWSVFNSIFERTGIRTMSGSEIVNGAVLMIIVDLVLLFIGAAWLHLWVHLFGGRKSYRETLKALAFGETPALLLGWIPLVGFLAWIWSLAVSVLGVSEFHGITITRALGAVILAVVVPLLILVLLASFFLIAYSEVTPLPVTGF